MILRSIWSVLVVGNRTPAESSQNIIYAGWGECFILCGRRARFWQKLGPSGPDILCVGMHEAGKRCTRPNFSKRLQMHWMTMLSMQIWSCVSISAFWLYRDIEHADKYIYKHDSETQLHTKMSVSLNPSRSLGFRSILFITKYLSFNILCFQDHSLL